MTPKETQETMQEGFDILCMWARNIAMLPLEDWDQAFDHAETVGPILDPTLFRQYMYSEKSKVIREIIQAAIPLKAAVLKAQPLVRKEMEASAIRHANK